MTMQDHALRLTDRNCFELDPRRPYLPTSPLTGIFHGDYRFKMGPGTDAPTVFDLYPRYQATAYMEFGVPSPPSAARLREVIPADEIWPVGPTKSWKAHNAFGAWHSGEPGSWLYPEVAEHYFGPAASLEQMVERLQLLQAEGYKAIYEEGRRQKPVCSAVACWVFNESWPCAANNSLVAWPCEPKPGYFAVAAANRPTMASARILRFDWKPGEEFAAELFLLHDGPAPLPACTVRVFLETASGRTELASWACPGAPANAHAAGPKVRGKVPQNQGQTFDVVLEVAGQPALGSRYTLAFKR
jgi:beta-mannosidase